MTRRYDIAEIKAALPLSAVVGAVVSWDRRKTNARRGDFWAPCPFHQERTPSFHVDDRKGFYHCFGCGESGDHVTWCREWHGDDFGQALERLAALAGIGPAAAGAAQTARRPAPPPPEDTETPARRFAQARRIWRETRATDPVLMSYLAARGVAIEALERVWRGPPPAIRFHPALEHRDQATGKVVHRGPAMVALICGVGPVAGIHRTWITPEGRARGPDGAKLPKQWLGWTGAMYGVPVRITAHTDNMVVAEGIETVLAWWSRMELRWLDGRGEKWSAEAALSLNALAGAEDRRFRGPAHPVTGRPLPSDMPDRTRPGWQPPDYVKRLVILGDTSAKDPLSAERHAWRAQRRHAWRGDGTARRCELIIPPGGWGSGKDFADVAAEVAA